MRNILLIAGMLWFTGCSAFSPLEYKGLSLKNEELAKTPTPTPSPTPKEEIENNCTTSTVAQSKTTLWQKLFTVAAIPMAHAIIIRHDVPDSDYIVADADYPALVPLFGPNDCIATLVQKNFLITVAHCAAELVVGNSLTVGGNPHEIQEVILHPQWNDELNQNDIALIKLKTGVNGVTPLPLYQKSDELGKVIAIVGRGTFATGLVGEEGGANDPNLRRATNKVSSVNSMFLEVTFDRPGDPDVTPLEGVGAAGDSGGPSFIDVEGKAHIIGLNSWGDGEDTGVGVGEYTAKDYQTRVSQYIPWLKSNGLCIR